MNGSGLRSQERQGAHTRYGSASRSPVPPGRALVDGYAGSGGGGYEDRSRYNPVSPTDRLGRHDSEEQS